MIIEYSSMCFGQNDVDRKIDEAYDFLSREGLQFGIQLHNSIDKTLFDKILSYKKDIPLSVHSPVFSKYFLNLASDDTDLLFSLCDENIRYLDMAGTKIFFFHGFFLTKEPIIHDMKNYRATMKNIFGNTYSLNNSFIMSPDIFSTGLFEEYRKSFIKNLALIKERYKDYTITLENDFAGIGSGLQRPEEILTLVDNVWFDIGHLWTSALLHEFDFYEAADRITDEKNIVGIHINHNHMKKTDRREDIKDSHDHIYIKTEQHLKPLIQRLQKKGVTLFTLEILDGDIKDIETLLNWLS
jgi:hypothetical protein